MINSNGLGNAWLETGTANLGNGPVTITMIEGDGWITYGQQDIVVRAGQQVELHKSQHPVLISPLIIDNRIIFKMN